MTERKAVVIGLFVAALIPAVGFSVAMTKSLGYRHSLWDALEVVPFFYPFSLVAVLALGLPAFLLLRPFRPGNWWSVLVVGFLLGIPVAIVIRGGWAALSGVLMTGPLAAVSTLAFWLIWRWGSACEEQGRRRQSSH